MLHHVALELRRENVEECVHFYSLLGFRRVDPPPSLAARTAWVERGGSQIHMMHVAEPDVPSNGHLAVVVGEYDETLAALRAAGFEPDPREEHWGSPRAFVRDPAGHRVELMAFPPARSL